MLHARTRAPARYLERSLARYWRDHAAALPPLLCDDGSRLRVLYPGRQSAAAGPDFRDAVLQREDGSIVRGDVELHVRRSGWEAHGHHHDRGYNGVALHVALHGGGPPVRLASGERVPTALLFPRTLGRESWASASGVDAPPETAAPEPPPTDAAARPLPLAALPRSEARLARLLDREGDARFLGKVRALARALADASAAADGVLYRGLLHGLGYGGNSDAMLQLGEGLPLRALHRAAAGAGPAGRRDAMTAALLQASGLGAPEGAAPAQGAAIAMPVVPRDAWRLFRVRPANHPSRRLAGLAVLLDRAWDAGLPAWAAALTASGSVGAIRAALTVEADAGPALIGAARAADLAVNVLLPFGRAWGRHTGDTAMAEAALALYRAWPPLQENAITAEAQRLLAADCGAPPTALRSSARRQQGLIRLYRRIVGQDTPAPQAAPA